MALCCVSNGLCVLAAAGSSCAGVGLCESEHASCAGHRILRPRSRLPGLLKIGRPDGCVSLNY